MSNDITGRQRDIIDDMYDDLYNQGYLQKDRDTFRNFFFAPGEQGYKNRKALYDDLHGQGYLEAPTYEDFTQRIGLHEEKQQATGHGGGVDNATYGTGAASAGEMVAQAAQPEQPTQPAVVAPGQKDNGPKGQAMFTDDELRAQIREAQRENQPTQQGYAKGSSGNYGPTRADQQGVYITPEGQTPEEKAMQERMSQVGEIYDEPESYSFEPDAGDGKMHYSWRNGRRIGQLDPGALRFAHIGRDYSSEAYKQAEQEAAGMTDEQLRDAFNRLYASYSGSGDDALMQGYGRDDASRMMAYATEMRYRDVGMGHASDYGGDGQQSQTGVYHYHAARMNPAVAAEMDAQDKMGWDQRLSYLSDVLKHKQAMENVINTGRYTNKDSEALEEDRRKLLAGVMLYARDNHIYPEDAYRIVVGAANNATPKDSGFWAGFTSTTSQMWRDVKYFFGEAANLVANDRGDVLDAISALDKYGDDADTKLIAGTLHNLGLLGMLIFDGDEAAASEGAGRILSECIVKDKDGRIDVDATRAALMRKLHTTFSWGDRTMRDNVYNTAMAKQVEGNAAWWGQQMAQLVPTAAAVVVGVTTKNPALAEAIGQVGMGYMCISSGSQAMQEARMYGASDSQVWTAGIVNAALEYVFEKIPFDRYTKRVFGEVKATSARKLMDAVADVNHPAHHEIQQLLEQAKKELGNGKLAKAYAGDVLAEGSSEAVTGMLQKASEILYKNPEDYPTFMEILEEGVESAKGGAAMGGVMGSVSTGTTAVQADSRRKKAGVVSVGIYEGEDGMGVPVEIIDHDNAGNYIVLDGQHNELIVAPGKLKGVTTYSYDEWKRGEVQYEEAQAQVSGYNAEGGEREEVQDDLQRAEQRLDGLDFDLSSFEGWTSEAFEERIASGEHDYTDEDIEAIREYFRAKAASDGMQQRVEDDVDTQVQQASDLVDKQTNQGTGMVHRAVLNNGQEVYVTGGQLVMTGDGTMVDTEASDESLFVYNPATGQPEQYTPSDFQSVDDPVSPEQLKSEAARDIRQAVEQQAEADMNGYVQQGGAYDMVDEQGNALHGTVVELRPDNTAVVQVDGLHAPVAIPTQRLQTWVDNAKQARMSVAPAALPTRNAGQQASTGTGAAQSAAIPRQGAAQVPAQSQAPALPMDEKTGEPAWNKITPEQGYNHLTQSGLTSDDIGTMIDDRIAQADAAIEKASKGGTIDQRLQARQAKDYWENVKALHEAAKTAAQQRPTGQAGTNGRGATAAQGTGTTAGAPAGTVRVEAGQATTMPVGDVAVNPDGTRADDRGQLGIRREDTEYFLRAMSPRVMGLLDKVAKSLGWKIRLYNGENANERGHYDNGVVWVNRRAITSKLAQWILGHEMTHGMATRTGRGETFLSYVELANDLKRNEWGEKAYEKYIKDLIDAYQEHLRKRGMDPSKVNRAYIEEEIACDVTGDLLMNNPEMIGKLFSGVDSAAKKKSIIDMLVDAIDWIKRYLPFKSNERRALEKLSKRLNNLYRDAKAQADIAKATASEEGSRIESGEGEREGSSFSITGNAEGSGFTASETVCEVWRVPQEDGTYKEEEHWVKKPLLDSEGNVVFRMGDREFSGKNPITVDDLKSNPDTVLNYMLQDALNAGTIDETKADQVRQQYADMLNLYLEKGVADENGNGFENLEKKWLWVGETVFRTVASNSDEQYSYSIDITKVCKKNEAVIRAISAMQVKTGYGVTPAQILEIYETTDAEGFQVPCPVCYVFSRYINNGKYATAIVNGMKKYGKYLPGQAEAKPVEWWVKEMKDAQARAKKMETPIKNANDDVKVILQQIDALCREITSGKLSAEEAESKRRHVRALDQRYRAALDVISQEALPRWIKAFVIEGSDQGGWSLREDAALPEDMDDFTLHALDIRKTASAMEKYPALTRYRRAGGSAGGKEITFASNNELGSIVMGLGISKDKLDDYPNYYQLAAEAATDEERQALLQKARERFDKARLYAQRQTLRGGQRMWSWSDNIESLSSDVASNLMQLELLGGALQTYSKQLEGVKMVAAMNGYVNASLMGYGDGIREVGPDEIENGRLKDDIWDVNNKGRRRIIANAGSPVYHNEADGKDYVLVFDDVVGIDPFGHGGKRGLFSLNEEYDRAGNILVGMNDIHVRAAMADPRVFFIIPWHASGMSNHILQQMFSILGVDMDKFVSTDYTKMQEETNYLLKKDDGSPKKKVPKEVEDFWDSHTFEDEFACGTGHIENGDRQGGLSESQLHYRALRDAIFDGTAKDNQEMMDEILADEFLSQVYRQVTTHVADGKMTEKDKEFIYPYEYWDETSTVENADVNGRRYVEYCRRMGFKPKFTGKFDDKTGYSPEGNFADDPGYWKLLIDRRMYDRRGNYQGLTPVDSSGLDSSMYDPDETSEEFNVTEVATNEGAEKIADIVYQNDTERTGTMPAPNLDMSMDEAVDKYKEVTALQASLIKAEKQALDAAEVAKQKFEKANALKAADVDGRKAKSVARAQESARKAMEVARQKAREVEEIAGQFGDAGNAGAHGTARFSLATADEARYREVMREGGSLRIIRTENSYRPLVRDYDTGNWKSVPGHGGRWRIEGMPGEFGSREAAINEWRERAAGNVVWSIGKGGRTIEVDGEGDMYQTMSGTTTATQQRWAQQRAEKGRKMVDELAESLGVDVRYVDDMSDDERAALSERQRRAKGWFDTRTGEVYINLGNHNRLYDILATAMHETVAHKGLRQLMGDRFDDFLDNVYNNVDKHIRREIDRLAERNGGDVKAATEEYMAQLAERINPDSASRENMAAWERIRMWILDMLREAGAKLASLSDADLRAILYESYHNMQREGAMGVAQSVAFRDQVERERAARNAAIPRQGDAAELGDAGVRFSFGGPVGAEAMDALDGGRRLADRDVAEEMERAGKDAKTIKLATGWERGTDNKWRYEMPDVSQKVFKLSKASTLADIVDMNDLDEVYPVLKEYTVSFKGVGRNVAGEVNHKRKEIKMSKTYNTERVGVGNYILDDYGMKTIVHEIQHVIQKVEGFARGTNDYKEGMEVLKGHEGEVSPELMFFARGIAWTNSADGLIYYGNKDLAKKLKWTYPNQDSKEWQLGDFIEKLDPWLEYPDFVRRAADLVREAKKKAPDLYHRSAGEVEARNVEKRYGMTEEERRGSLAGETEDVPRGEQVLRFEEEKSERRFSLSNNDAERELKSLEDAASDAISSRNIQELERVIADLDGIISGLEFIKKNDKRRFNRQRDRYELLKPLQERLDGDLQALVKKTRTKNKPWGVEETDDSLTHDDLDALFKSHNTDKTNASLWDKVLATSRLLGLDSAYITKEMDFNILGALKDSRILQFNYYHMNSYARTDNQKCATMLHELIHHVASYALIMKDQKNCPAHIRQAAYQIVDIYNEIKDDPDFEGEYGITDEHEMIAELSNPVFRQKLKKKKLWKRLLDGLMRLFGVEQEGDKETSAYKMLVGALDNIVSNPDIKLYEEVLDAIDNAFYQENTDARFSISTEEQERQTRSENFKRWFGDWENDPENASKVVDAEGRPLVVYHANRDGSGFYEFDTSPEFNGMNYGSHFGTKAASEVFSDPEAYPDAKTYAVYLNLRNPLEVVDYFADDNSYWADLLVRLTRDNNIDDPEINAVVKDIHEKWPWIDGTEETYSGGEHDADRENSPYQLVEIPELYKAVRKAAEMLGYDGFKYENLMEDAGNYSYVAFHPEQIKSATDNNGDFSRENPDIRYSISEESQKIFDTAKKKFGETKDIREAGYVLPDGTMLDFSGRHELDPGTDSSFLAGRRTTDHRAVNQISFVYDEKGDEVDTGLETDMPDFIKRGAIRIDNNAGLINLSTAPTSAQKKVLRQLIAENGGDVQVDFGDGWDSDHYVEYDQAKPTRVLGDIDRYFDEGIKPQSNVRFSLSGDGTVEAYNKAVNMTGRTFNVGGREVKPGITRYNFQEAFQDAILAVKKLQQVVERHFGIKLPTRENAWMYENRLSSINMHERKSFIDKVYEPMMKIADAIMKRGVKEKELNAYLICKHGLERNRVFAERDAQAEYDEIIRNGGTADLQQLIDEKRQRDYSGLTGVTGIEGDIADIEAEAQRIVDEFEQRHGQLCNELWDAIRKATQWSLRKSYQSGMMSAATFDHVRNMFQYYIPLRGWSETTAEDVYSYMMGEHGAFNGVLKQAKGRTSVADDPLATIGNMAESAMIQGNRNLLKQHLLRMAQNHPTDVCQVRDVWLVEGPGGVWEPHWPNIPEDATPDEIDQILQDHDADMLQLEAGGSAKRVRNNLDIPYRIDPRHVPEHAVVAKVAGIDHVVYINGNPRAAQAINGMTGAPRGTKSGFMRLVDFIFGDMKRFYSSVLTSLNINFSGANFVRDLPHAYAMTFSKYGPLKAAEYIAKSFQVIPWVFKNQLGKTGTSQMDRYFQEFLSSGAVTGYAHINDVDAWKADNKRRWARLSALGKAKVAVPRALGEVINAIGWFSETLELIPRFTAFLVERQAGKDIATATKAAKDITTNFNKKGSEVTPGVWGAVANTLRYMKMFFNPIVQGMYQFVDVASMGNENKWVGPRMALATMHLPILGAIVPYLNQFLLEALGGDDDDDYWLLNEYTRRNNVCIFTGNGYLKIPIAPVFRELYGMGEVVATRHAGKADNEKSVIDLIDQLRTMGSVEGQSSYNEWSLARFLLPEHFAPLIDVMNNENFTGGPIYYDNNYKEYAPEYTKAKKSTWSPLVAASKWLNEMMGGDEDIAAGNSGKWMNPAVWQHLITNVGGGFAQLAGDVVSGITDIAEGKEIDASNMPVLKRFYSNSSDERAQWARFGIYKDFEKDYTLAKEKYQALDKRGLSLTERADEMVKFAESHPRAAAIYAVWEGGIKGSDIPQQLSKLGKDDPKYWDLVKEAVAKAEKAMNSGYVRAWEQKRKDRPDSMSDKELNDRFDKSDNDSIRHIMADEISKRAGSQDYYGRDAQAAWSDKSVAAWEAYQDQRTSDDIKADAELSNLLKVDEDEKDKERIKMLGYIKDELNKIRRGKDATSRSAGVKGLGEGDDERIMEELRAARKQLIEDLKSGSAEQAYRNLERRTMRLGLRKKAKEL